MPRLLPSPGPTLDLSPHESLGPSQVAKSASIWVDRVKLDEGVHHDLRKRSIDIWVISSPQIFRDVASYHQAVLALHQEEGCAQHGDVVAISNCTGSLVKGLPQSRQNPILPTHVMRGSGNRPERGSTQDQLLPLGEGQEVRQIGFPPTKLVNPRDTTREAGILRDPSHQAVDIEPLIWPDFDQIGHCR